MTSLLYNIAMTYTNIKADEASCGTSLLSDN